jgi:hypothetical protein
MIILLMHVLIIFILIVGLVLARISSPRLNEGFEAEDKDDDYDDDEKKPDPITQPPLYSGVW